MAEQSKNSSDRGRGDKGRGHQRPGKDGAGGRGSGPRSDDRGSRDRRPPRRQDGRSPGGDREGRRHDGDRARGASREAREDRGPRGTGRPGRPGPDRRRDDSREEHRTSRPGQEARAQRPYEPEIPDGITGQELDQEIRDELRGLSRETAERVARHLVAAYLLEAEDVEASQAHARFAARVGGRIGGVRESYGVLAYRAGDFRTAVRELRTSLRITGRTDVLPMIADSERGLGRPERALDMAGSDEASQLGVDAAIELMIVVAGAYADTGDIQTALRTLEIPALRHKVDGRWQVRLWVAYADLLERGGRREESKRWLTLAADADTEGLTGAGERLGRPAAPPVAETAWDDEEISVLDAYDESADAEADSWPQDGASEAAGTGSDRRQQGPDAAGDAAGGEEPARAMATSADSGSEEQR